MKRLYADRDIIALGQHYTAHVGAMTTEGLHSKSEIAAELAARDAVLAKLLKLESERRIDSPWSWWRSWGEAITEACQLLGIDSDDRSKP